MIVVETHKKFDSFEEASRHAKRLIYAVNYTCKRKNIK